LTKALNRFATRLLPLVKRQLPFDIAAKTIVALSIIRCLKSAQKFAVRVCQVATVVMETTQLILSQFKNFLIMSLEN